MATDAQDREEWDATYFAPAGRAEHRELTAQIQRSLEDPCVQAVLEAVSGFVLVPNSKRQVLCANQELLRALGREDPSCLVGLRPGEVVNCIQFTEGPDGCGTSRHCGACGAVLAILASQVKNHPVAGECNLSVYRQRKLVALNMQVRCSPLEVGGEQLVIMVLHDTSALKRLTVMEQVFLHDFLNTIGGLDGWSKVLRDSPSQAVASEIIALIDSLKEDALAQRLLLDAENGQLRVNADLCGAVDILQRLQAVFDRHPVRGDKQLIVLPVAQGESFETDRALLLRVLTNMLKNAFEATGAGGSVRLWFERREGRPGFVVQNQGTIPEAIRLRLFERSFSTQATQGHGLGTYSMKLFGERFLGGAISYSSAESTGTCFSIFLPESKKHVATASTAPAVEAGASSTRGRRVLLVDDDESLLRLAELFVSRLGLSVTACDNGFRAWELFQANPGQFGAAIVDWTMPGLDGLELSRRIAEAAPALPIFLCTGFGGSELLENAEAPWIRAIVEKPYTAQRLKEKLRFLLPNGQAKLPV